MVFPSAIDRYYPASNAKEIQKIASDALLIAEYPEGFLPYRGSFLERNRLVIALSVSECVIIPQADLGRGSMHSAQISQKLHKKLFVFSHRMGESLGAQSLIQANQVTVITDLDRSLEEIRDLLKLHKNTPAVDIETDDLLQFCKNAPLEIEVIEAFGLERFLEEQLKGNITLFHGRVLVGR